MTNTITLRDSGGASENDYKLVFSGDDKPEFANVHDATPSPDARIYRNARGEWCVVDHIWGGIDAWTYSGRKLRMAFADPSRVEGQVNDKGWFSIENFDSAEAFAAGGGPGGSGDSDGSGSPVPPTDSSADENPENGGDSSDRDTSGDTHLPTSTTTSTLTGEQPGLGCVARSMYSAGDIEMHVGDGRAFDSLQAAFNVVPHYLLHECRIFVHGRTADRNTAHIHSVQMANHVDFIVDGSDGGIVTDGGVNVHIDGKLDHIQFDYLTFEDISQCIDARFEGCSFGGNGTAAFSGKAGGKMLIDCEFPTGQDYSVFSIGSEMVELRNCTLRGETAAVRGNAASVHVFNNNRIEAPRKMAGGADGVFVGGERL